MGTKIFINLPVKNLKETTMFYNKLGYRFDPQFSDEKAQCMIVTDDIYFMFLTEQFFRSFTGKDVPDNTATSGAIFAITSESREAVDQFMDRCLEAGGTDVSLPQTVDFMYTRAFEDPEGHRWEVFYMDMVKVRNEPKAQPV